MTPAIEPGGTLLTGEDYRRYQAVMQVAQDYVEMQVTGIVRPFGDPSAPSAFQPFRRCHECSRRLGYENAGPKIDADTRRGHIDRCYVGRFEVALGIARPADVEERTRITERMQDWAPGPARTQYLADLVAFERMVEERTMARGG